MQYDNACIIHCICVYRGVSDGSMTFTFSIQGFIYPVSHFNLTPVLSRKVLLRSSIEYSGTFRIQKYDVRKTIFGPKFKMAALRSPTCFFYGNISCSSFKPFASGAINRHRTEVARNEARMHEVLLCTFVFG